MDFHTPRIELCLPPFAGTPEDYKKILPEVYLYIYIFIYFVAVRYVNEKEKLKKKKKKKNRVAN